MLGLHKYHQNYLLLKQSWVYPDCAKEEHYLDRASLMSDERQHGNNCKVWEFEDGCLSMGACLRLDKGHDIIV